MMVNGLTLVKFSKKIFVRVAVFTSTMTVMFILETSNKIGFTGKVAIYLTAVICMRVK
jgi:hypothetical protein